MGACRQAGKFPPEKATYGIAVIAVFAPGRGSGQMLAVGLFDLAVGVLYVVVEYVGMVGHAGLRE